MNKVFRQTLPVSELPKRLSEEFGSDAMVHVVAEDVRNVGVKGTSQPSGGHFSRFKHLRRPHFASSAEVVDHVRALRDEWRDR
jgi:hypothetical protein